MPFLTPPLKTPKIRVFGIPPPFLALFGTPLKRGPLLRLTNLGVLEHRKLVAYVNQRKSVHPVGQALCRPRGRVTGALPPKRGAQ